METARSTLVNNACDIGTSTLERDDEQRDGSIVSQWHSWIDRERDCRLSWGVFENDSSATFLYNARPYIRLARMPIHLFCSDELWEAKTAQEWAALRDSHNQVLRGPYFPDLLDEIMVSDDGLPVSRLTNIRHQRILMLTISRMEWTLKDIRASTPAYYARKGKNFFLDETRDVHKIMGFFEDAIRSRLKSALLNSEEYLSAARNLPLAHISHMHSSGDLMDWLYLFLQNDSSDLRRGQIRRARWVSQRLCRVRQTAFHCAQILGLSRRYPQAFPQLPFVIFHAAAALWCIAPYINGPSKAPSTSSNTPSNEPGQTDKVLLDDIPEFRKAEALADPATVSAYLKQQTDLSIWLDAGERGHRQSRLIVAGIEGVRDVSTESGRLQVLRTGADLLRQGTAPGICDKFRAVFEVITQNRENWK